MVLTFRISLSSEAIAMADILFTVSLVGGITAVTLIGATLFGIALGLIKV